MFTTLLLTALVGQVDVPTLESPTRVEARQGADANAQSVAISFDGQRVAAGFGGSFGGSDRPPSGSVRVWDRQSGKLLYETAEFGDVVQLGFSHKGRYLAYTRLYTPGDSVEANATVLIDLEKQEKLKSWGWGSTASAFSPTEDLLFVSTRGSFEFVELPSLEVRQKLDLRSVRSIACRPDGKQLATLGYYWENRRGTPNGLTLVDVATGETRVLSHDESLRTANAVVYSPDGDQLATGHTAGLVQVWSRDDEQPTLKLQIDSPMSVRPLYAAETLILATQPAGGVRWSYDRDEASGFRFSKDRTPPWSDLHFLEPASGKQVRQWRVEDAAFRTYYARFGSSRNHPEYNPQRLALSADGKTLVVAGNGCCTVDLRSGKIERVYGK